MKPFKLVIPILSCVAINALNRNDSCLTTLNQNSDKLVYLNHSLNNKSIGQCISQKTGTLITTSDYFNINKLTEDHMGFFNSNYDIFVKIPQTKVVFNKMKVKSITKYSPIIVI